MSKSVVEQMLPSQSDMPYFEISAKENNGIEDVSFYKFTVQSIHVIKNCI